MKYINPAYCLMFTDLTKINLGSFQILMPQITYDTISNGTPFRLA